MKKPKCNNCKKAVYKKYGYHMTEYIENGTYKNAFYHWDCMGDYGKRVNQVLEEVNA
jgi:hypothetical protein